MLKDYEFGVLKIDMSLLRNVNCGLSKIISSVGNMSKMLVTHCRGAV